MSAGPLNLAQAAGSELSLVSSFMPRSIMTLISGCATRLRAIALALETKVMIERGMKELTSESSLPAAWARFIGPADVVGIKINPSGAPACCSSPEIIREIVGGVQSVGVPASNIFIYDRYAYEIDVGSYQALVPPGVRVVGIQDAFSGPAGYDMNV